MKRIVYKILGVGNLFSDVCFLLLLRLIKPNRLLWLLPKL
jgi:hypothetical protein